MAKKRRTDTKVRNSDGLTRVKPIKNLGKDEQGREIQNLSVKRSDGATTTKRYADGKEIGETYTPKKLKPKKMRKPRKPSVPRKLKKVKAPSYIAPAVTFDENPTKTTKKKKKKSLVKKTIDKVKKIKLPKIKKGRKVRKIRNLVTGGVNKLR